MVFQAIFLLWGATPASSAEGGDPVRLEHRKVAGVWANVVTVDLNNPRVSLTPVMADPGDHRTFLSLLNWGYRPGAPTEEARLVAAINGTFFDPPTATVICNLVARGRLLSEGSVGNTLIVDSQNQARLRITAGWGGSRFNWSDAHFAVSAGPTLLREGEVALDPYSEGFSDPGLFRQARRSALGITPQNKLLLVTVNTPVSLRRLAWMMSQAGAMDAINLDGGSSTALYYRGRMVSRPKRLLTNLIAVHVRTLSPAPAPVPVDLPQTL
ncbi:MAG: phosphodiester glycosidase family protein, partial [Candidatus Eremiobacterota bacterium]